MQYFLKLQEYDSSFTSKNMLIFTIKNIYYRVLQYAQKFIKLFFSIYTILIQHTIKDKAHCLKHYNP